MDLLANYADDGSNTPTTDSYDKVSNSAMMQLEAEWESFEKIMGDDVMASSADKLLSEQSTEECTVQQFSPSDIRRSSSASSAKRRSESSKDGEDEGSFTGSGSDDSDNDNDDRKSGRERSDSVSSGSSAASSASGKSSVSRHSTGSGKASEGSHEDVADVAEDCGLSKTINKIGAKRSRSRTGSRSPSRKHRRSADHRCSHSKDRHKHSSHSKRDRKRRHSRSRSRDRHHSRRHSSRDRHHRRRRSISRSRDSHRRHHRRHSSSRKHRHHSSDHKKSSSDKHSSHRRRSSRSRSHEKKNTSSEASSSKTDRPIASAAAIAGGDARKMGPSVMYRTAGVKFHRDSGSNKPLTFKEQMKQQILQSAKLMSEKAAAGGAEDGFKPTNLMERPNMPLNSSNIYGSIATTSAGCGLMSGGHVTPQIAFLHTVAALHKQAQEITGVEVPKYYNPAAVNPLKYAEQVQKRKLLWSKAKEKKETNSQWNAQAVVADGDSRTQAKFKKLMGIKGASETEVEASGSSTADPKALEQRQKQEELFHQLDKEYEFARMATHTHRGVGLGFGSQIYQHH